MSRWAGFLICTILGLVMLCCGLQVPVHLRAVDVSVLQQAGRNTPSLIGEGVVLAKNNQLGAAQLFFAAAQSAWLTNSQKLSDAVDDLARRRPELKIFGSTEPGSIGVLLQGNAGASEARPAGDAEPFTEFIIRSENRSKALEMLQASRNPLVEELLHLRSITGTVLFPASSSTSGQAFDAAVCTCGLLAEAGHLSSGLSNSVQVLATEADRAGSSPQLEQVLLDVTSLGQRLNWGQLASFVEPVKDPETLGVLANLMRRGESVPVVFAAVRLTDNAGGVAKYLMHFTESGLNDLRLSLGSGAGGLNELLQRNQRLCHSTIRERIAAYGPFKPLSAAVLNYAQGEPSVALAGKWLLYLLGGFFLAAAVHCARRVTELERPLEVRGFHLAREFLFASGFLLVVLLLSEPFLSQGQQQGAFPFRVRLSAVGSAFVAGATGAKSSAMNESNLLTLLLFFVLQALIYIACLVKLAEIRRQRIAPRVKLKLLENEDHLFDAGLYLGFVGTIISLILFSLGVIKPSLMAAYSSTSFGIIFVSCFKIFNLRPVRRKLLLESEAESPARSAYAAEATYASQS